MTHQEIADAKDAVFKRSMELFRERENWIRSEYQRLQAECSQVGHIFGRSAHALISENKLVCKICGASQ